MIFENTDAIVGPVCCINSPFVTPDPISRTCSKCIDPPKLCSVTRMEESNTINIPFRGCKKNTAIHMSLFFDSYYMKNYINSPIIIKIIVTKVNPCCNCLIQCISKADEERCSKTTCACSTGSFTVVKCHPVYDGAL